MRLGLVTVGLFVALGALPRLANAHNGQHAQDDQSLVNHFLPNALAAEPKIVDCTLSRGTQTKCISLTTRSEPVGFTIGPWCPRTIKDGPEKAGIWLHDGKVHNADGTFIVNAPTFFKDNKWQLFDPNTGRVKVTDTEAACRAAARPDVDPAYQNYCVECQTSYVKEGSALTYVIPLKPVPVKKPGKRVSRDGTGLSFNGARLDAPAPLHAILKAHTLAPFDDCGGHVNPHVGYHIHAVTDCLKSVSIHAQHPPLIGIALDGYAIAKPLSKGSIHEADLDECGGHRDEKLGYHYHAGQAGSNAILGCHAGERGCVSNAANEPCNAWTWMAWIPSWIE